MTASGRRRAASDQPASPVKLLRTVPKDVERRLIAASAGRCELRGCNKNLYVHSVTNMPGNFAEKAHIVAFRPSGPRGSESRPSDIHAFENVMLLCLECHHLIDTNRGQYSVEALREQKREHEERILSHTDSGPEYRTTVIQLRGAIGGQPVDISASEIRTALLPRYPARLPGVLIDLTAIQAEDPAFFTVACDQIRRELRPALRAELESKRVQHYSVFALAPIPVLAYLGRELGDKVNVDLFQRHRGSQSWKWRPEGTAAEYVFEVRRRETGRDNVGLILSLSGKVTESSLLPGVSGRCSLYEITLKGQKPNREFLRLRDDLVRFRRAYQEALGTIMKNHDAIRELHLFPAVPAPVAIACGQELLPKVHPDLIVYDNVKGTFRPAITINTRAQL
jgi:hypothetical protein